MTDENLSEHLDSDLDAVAVDDGGDEWWLPGPLSLAHLVGGIHVVTGIAVLPFLWLAYANGNFGQAAALGGLILLLSIAGLVTGRVTARRYE